MEVCYRHPDRDTGVACSNCARPICPDCMTPTSVGMRCPECSQQRTQVRGLPGASSTEPVLTYALIAVSVLVGLALMLGAGTEGANAIYEHGALSRSTIADGEWWRLVTSGFIHGDGVGGSSVLIHLLFNMFVLYILGRMLEPEIGRLRFGLIYVVSLLAGSFGALLLEPTRFTVGASGAIFGLMGAAVVVMRNRGINPMESGLGLWIGLNLVLTFTIKSISIGGHIGGLIGGSVAALLLFELRDRLRMPGYVPSLLAGALGAAAAVGAIVVSA